MDEVNNIKKLRKINKKTQQEIADILSITQSQYSRIENNKCYISVDHLTKLSEYYGVSIEYLLNKNLNK